MGAYLLARPYIFFHGLHYVPKRRQRLADDFEAGPTLLPLEVCKDVGEVDGRVELFLG